MNNNTMTTETAMTLTASYHDDKGTEYVLQGESVEEIAGQLPEDYNGPTIEVFDEPGFVRGWVRSRTDWRAQ